MWFASESYFCTPKKQVLIKKRGSSSFGRARPCQGRGGRFEPGLPLSKRSRFMRDFFSGSPGGGIGRHAGLKILFAAMRVTVQLRSGARLQPIRDDRLFYLVPGCNTYGIVPCVAHLYCRPIFNSSEPILPWSALLHQQPGSTVVNTTPTNFTTNVLQQPECYNQYIVWQ